MPVVKVAGAAPGHESDVRAGEELEAMLDRLHEEACTGQPKIIDLTADNGANLGIGLGRADSVLTFERSLDPPYFRSVSDDQAGVDPVAVFFYQGHWSEFPRRAVVPIGLAREAARQFALTGSRPTAVDWEEV